MNATILHTCIQHNTDDYRAIDKLDVIIALDGHVPFKTQVNCNKLIMTVEDHPGVYILVVHNCGVSEGDTNSYGPRYKLRFNHRIFQMCLKTFTII